MRYRFVGAVLALFACAAWASGEAITGCEPRDGLEPICGVHGSEDIEVMPGGKQLIVSQSRVSLDTAHHLVWLPGSIALLDLATKKSRIIYPSGVSASTAERWGDMACPGEISDSLSPHGMHLSRRNDGRMQLLVVNHGGRESVEMFEVKGKGRRIGLVWRGCAVAPAMSFLNDTVALADGGFLVTNMTLNDAPDAMMKSMERAERGENTGNVLQWQPGAGYSVLPGSELPMPNGIQISRDGAFLFVDVGGTNGEVRKLDRRTGRQLGAAKVPHPDNVSWSRDGRLLVAGLQNGANVKACMDVRFAATCGAAFHVIAVDPETMKTETLLAHEGAPMGMATVAVQAGNSLYVGSVAGDRILKVPLVRRR